MSWQSVPAILVRGHQVASGGNGNPRFPGGTLRMQAPHFAARGLDITPYHAATLNLDISPARFEVVASRLTFRQVKWHPEAPAEDFSFFACRVIPYLGKPISGLIYYPHPETKPEHHQPDGLLEVLAP